MKFKLAVILFIALCSFGCDDCNKNPLSPDYAAKGRVSAWFHPNLGSKDLIDMFREGRENEWAQTRSKIEVFQFHHGALLYTSCAPLCGFNNENNFSNLVSARPGGPFAWLNRQDIKIAFEAGAVKPWHCGKDQMPDDTIAGALEAIRNVESSGGIVSYLSMDEPFTGLTWPPCSRNDPGIIQEAAHKTKYFIDGIHRFAPQVQVGLTEAYPHNSAQEIADGILALSSEGVNIPYLHLDIDLINIRNSNSDTRADLVQIRDFCRSRGITFGVIMGSGLGISNETFFNDVMRVAAITRESVGAPERLLFESWSDYPPTRTSPNNDQLNLRLNPSNLPETEGMTHTWILLRLLDYFGM